MLIFGGPAFGMLQMVQQLGVTVAGITLTAAAAALIALGMMRNRPHREQA